MLRLLLVRHAEAMSHAPGGDRERPLTKHGLAEAAKLGRYCQANGLVPLLALVSPARRARETFAAMLEAFSSTLPEAVTDELYHADVEGLRDLLGRIPSAAETLLMIGHNPALAEFARSLVDPRQSDPRRLHHFPAPCLAVIDFRATAWSDASNGGGRLERFVHFAGMLADDRPSS